MTEAEQERARVVGLPVIRDFKIIPGPPHDDGRWRFVFTDKGTFARHPEHPARFLALGSDWWKVVVPVEDDPDAGVHLKGVE